MSKPKYEDVGSFFDSISVDYDGLIERCVPRYREMIWALFSYMPTTKPVRSVLELGAGTGNLSSILLQRFPDARVTLVDIAPEMLDVCRERLGNDSRLQYEVADFNSLEYEPESFDLVTSSIAIHHVDATAKRSLFNKVYSWLRADGVFAFADQFSGATDELYQKHIENWRVEAKRLGASDADWQVWMNHQAEADHHDPLPKQISWLRESGFPIVDSPWRYLLWTVVIAMKSSSS